MEEFDQKVFVSKLLESVRCDNQLYKQAEKLIEKATQKGLFEKVKFYAPKEETV